jgi:3-methyladenine DNA glycosylase/8-oxoguanine DNA glycosylase
MQRRAVRHLQRVDPVMGRVISLVGPCRLLVRREGTAFDFLARSIVYQQLSGKAAATIYERVRALSGGPWITPRTVQSAPDATLRAAGLSRQKIAYLRDLVSHVDAGRLPVESLEERADEDIATVLRQVRGIGIWTVQMFLIFRLGRADVLPVSDLGVRKGVQVAYRLRKLPPPDRVEKIGACWAPYRSIASWYLWRVLEVDRALLRTARRRPAAAAGAGPYDA